MNNRTILYARVSTEDQLEKYGLPAQLRACREYAANHALTVVEEICDEGISGAILERPGINRIRDLVNAGAVDVVLALDTDRLSRELEHLLIIAREVEKRARLEFVTAVFDDSLTGKLFFQIKGAFSQYERGVIRERTMRGRREKVKQGLYVGGRIPYGYLLKDGRLEIDPAKAQTVKSIYDWYLSGFSIRAITLRLRENGSKPHYGRVWQKSSVRHLLENETFAGVAYWNKFRREGPVLKLKPLEQRIPILCPSLIDREAWNRVQMKLSENQIQGRPSSALLRGLLYCHCGRRMSSEKSRSDHAYRCHGRDRQNGTAEYCKDRIGIPRTDAAVWNALVKTYGDTDYLYAVLNRHRKELRKTNAAESLKDLEAQARKLRSREDRCLSMMLDSELAEEAQMLKAKLAEAKRERFQIEQKISGLRNVESQMQSAEEWLNSTAGLLHEYLSQVTDALERQRIFRVLVQRAEWTGKGEVRMACFFGRKLDSVSAHSVHFPSLLSFFVSARLAA